MKSHYGTGIVLLGACATVFQVGPLAAAPSFDAVSQSVQSLPDRTPCDFSKRAVMEIAHERAKASTDAGMPDKTAPTPNYLGISIY